MSLTAQLTISAHSALALACASAVFAAVPGPGVAAVVSQAVGRGLKQSLLWSLGIVLGDAAYLLLALFGMGLVAQSLGSAFVVLKWAGAAYLVYLGLRCLLARPQAQGESPARPEGSLARTFLGGFCVSAGNPKVVAFYCGFLPGFVDMAALTPLDALCVAGIILPTVYTVLALYGLLAARGRGLARSGRFGVLARRTAGAVMIGAGVAVAAD